MEIAQFGTWRINGTVVPLYETLGPEAVAYYNIIRNNDKYIIGKIIKNTNIEDNPSKYIQVLQYQVVSL